MLWGLPYGQEVDWWALGIVIYVMMAGRFPFHVTDKKRLQQEIKCHEVQYPMGISKEAEMIMRRVSIINIMIEALHVLE